MPEPLASQLSTASTSYSEWEDLNIIRACDESFDTAAADTSLDSEATTLTVSSEGNNDPSSSTSKRKERDITPPIEERPQKRVRTNPDSPAKAGAKAPGPRPLGAWASPEDNIMIGKDLSRKQLIDVRRLGFGIQYTLAELLLSDERVTTALILQRLPELRGTHEAKGPHVRELVVNGKADTNRLRGREKELSAKAPHRELDREHDAFIRDQFGCMGGVTSESTGLAWYGGQVSFSGKVSWNPEHKCLEFGLCEAEIGASSRFTRRWGSDFMIRVRIHRDVYAGDKSGQRLEMAYRFLLEPLVIWGRVYRFMYANKEHTAFYVATNETLPPKVDVRDSKRFLSLYDFIMWHNPIHANTGQTLAKYNARTALGTSNSIPGIRLLPIQIRYTPEIISTAYIQGSGKVPTEMEMTDGCGLITLGGAKALYNLGFWDKMPTAIQVRILGAKGLLLLDPNHRDVDEPIVHLRPSQVKIKFPDDFPLNDPAHVTIDVLRASHMKCGVRLSREMLTNLAENKVPPMVIEGIMTDQLKQAIDDLLAWHAVGWNGEPSEAMDKAMRLLWVAVERSGHVLAARDARENPGTARVRGLRAYDREEEESDDEDDEEGDVSARHQRSTAWFPDEVSGCPSSLEETVMTFIDGGFNPFTNPIMALKLHEVVKKTIRSFSIKFRLSVPMSCSGFCVPDPLGVLEEGEIHVKCSNPYLLLPDGRRTDKIAGDVLVSRSPCKSPTDIQKVKAVYKAELDEYSDVIIFSTKGKRSLASLLGGGDYDGDKVDVIWDPEIVKPFCNAPVELADAPAKFEEENFELENETVAEFLGRVGTGPQAIVRGIQEAQMKSLYEAPIGIYSSAHDNAVFLFGYADPKTLRLGRMFCNVLDGTKSGLTVKPDVLRNDMIAFKTSKIPPWKIRLNSLRNSHRTSDNSAYLQRDVNKFGVFILTRLDEIIHKESNNQLARAQKCFEDLVKNTKPDHDLTKAYVEASARAHRRANEKKDPGMLEELEQIENRVKEAFVAHVQAKEAARPQQNSKRGKDHSFTNLSIEKRQDILRAISVQLDGFPDSNNCTLEYFSYEEAVRVRASYAYYYVYAFKRPSSPSRFPFDVAMRELCLAKARARPGWHAVASHIHDAMRVRKA
ncbi:hypothetical protein PENSPDRAFT_650156 [Peniophora sp. CONT]|nr:hypothetical protein PENSPDRAFT_650156 [Peniophora sp. CONT]